MVTQNTKNQGNSSNKDSSNKSAVSVGHYETTELGTRRLVSITTTQPSGEVTTSKYSYTSKGGGGTSKVSEQISSTKPETITTSKGETQTIKYYINPITNTITYRVGGSSPPPNATEITPEAYKQIESYVSKGGRVQDIVKEGMVGISQEGKVYRVPIGAKVQDLKSLPSKLTTSKTSGEYISALERNKLVLKEQPYLTQTNINEPLGLYQGEKEVKPSLEQAKGLAYSSTLYSLNEQAKEEQKKRELASNLTQDILTPQAVKELKPEPKPLEKPSVFRSPYSFKQIIDLQKQEERTKMFQDYQKEVSLRKELISSYNPSKTTSMTLSLAEQATNLSLPKAIKTTQEKAIPYFERKGLEQERLFTKSPLGKLSISQISSGKESFAKKEYLKGAGFYFLGGALGSVQSASQEPLTTGATLLALPLLPARALGTIAGLTATYSILSKKKEGTPLFGAVAETAGEFAPYALISGGEFKTKTLIKSNTKQPYKVTRLKGLRTTETLTESGLKQTSIQPYTESRIFNYYKKNLPKVSTEFYTSLQGEIKSPMLGNIETRSVQDYFGKITRDKGKTNLEYLGYPKVDIIKSESTEGLFNVQPYKSLKTFESQKITPRQTKESIRYKLFNYELPILEGRGKLESGRFINEQYLNKAKLNLYPFAGAKEIKVKPYISYIKSTINIEKPIQIGNLPKTFDIQKTSLFYGKAIKKSELPKEIKSSLRVKKEKEPFLIYSSEPLTAIAQTSSNLFTRKLPKSRLNNIWEIEPLYKQLEFKPVTSFNQIINPKEETKPLLSLIPDITQKRKPFYKSILLPMEKEKKSLKPLVDISQINKEETKPIFKVSLKPKEELKTIPLLAIKPITTPKRKIRMPITNFITPQTTPSFPPPTFEDYLKPSTKKKKESKQKKEKGLYIPSLTGIALYRQTRFVLPKEPKFSISVGIRPLTKQSELIIKGVSI